MARRALGPASLALVQAVRAALTEAPVPADAALVVACSGGPDSLALAAATKAAVGDSGRRLAGVVVDHGLQIGSAVQAERTADQLETLGYDDRIVLQAEPGPAGLGPEGAARAGRYAALDAEAGRRDAVVLLGHTLDDQAETVLLGLARGSGVRSLAGMAAWSTPYLRPLLGLSRAQTEACCAEYGLAPWSDPHNDDPAFTRVRVRRRVLPVLEAVLGPAGPGERVAQALARTAALARDDADLLDDLAADLARACVTSAGLEVGPLADAPSALRSRVLRRWLLDQGGRPAGFEHVRAVEALITRWHGQHGIDLPGLRVRRRAGRLVTEPIDGRGD